LEYNGHEVDFNGFRLRDLSTWAVGPDHSLFDNLGSLSGYCNARCNFCYEFGNPLPYDLTMLGLAETRTRARYYDPVRRTGLIPFSQRLDLEPFTNPRLVEILSVFRAHDENRVITLTTNGARLDDAMLERLAALAPIQLVISINSADSGRRRALMHDPHKDIAAQAVTKIQQFHIPFTGGIVAWPELPDEDIRHTIHFFEQHNARAIRVSLPSYSRYFSGRRTLFNTESEWDRLFALVEKEADCIGTPLSAAPYLPRGVPIVPRVSGVIRNSPAFFAGVRRGDIIVRVNGRIAPSRMACKRLLAEAARDCQGVVRIIVERRGQALEFTLDDQLDPQLDLYPYKPKFYKSPSSYGETSGSLLGLFLNDDIDPDDVMSAVQVARRRHARSIVVLTSRLLEDIVSAYFEHNPTLVRATADMEVMVVSPQHHFWGGNIVVGDLYLCEDYIACLNRLTRKLGRKPDLAIIPCTFSPNYWTDLAGVPYSEIELHTGIAVELVNCARIQI